MCPNNSAEPTAFIFKVDVISSPAEGGITHKPAVGKLTAV
jgi:hypothetical protein